MNFSKINLIARVKTAVLFPSQQLRNHRGWLTTFFSLLLLWIENGFSQANKDLLPLLGARNGEDPTQRLLSYDTIAILFYLITALLLLFVMLPSALKLKFAQEQNNNFRELWIKVKIKDKKNDLDDLEQNPQKEPPKEKRQCAYIKDFYKSSMTLITSVPYAANDEMTLLLNTKDQNPNFKNSIDREAPSLDPVISGKVKRCTRARRFGDCYRIKLKIQKSRLPVLQN